MTCNNDYCRQHSGPPVIHADSKAEERYLNLEQLGMVLKGLSEFFPGKCLVSKKVCLYMLCMYLRQSPTAPIFFIPISERWLS